MGAVSVGGAPSRSPKRYGRALFPAVGAGQLREPHASRTRPRWHVQGCCHGYGCASVVRRAKPHTPRRRGSAGRAAKVGEGPTGPGHAGRARPSGGAPPHLSSWRLRESAESLDAMLPPPRTRPRLVAELSSLTRECCNGSPGEGAVRSRGRGAVVGETAAAGGAETPLGGAVSPPARPPSAALPRASGGPTGSAHALLALLYRVSTS